jgi:1-deoxy-D-xylulose-5-phosphate reductoisomerase
MERFPALELGFDVVRQGGTMGAALSGADEVAVGAFLDGRLGFTDIVPLVGRVLETHRRRSAQPGPTLDEVLSADAWAREEATRCLTSYTLSR